MMGLIKTLSTYLLTEKTNCETTDTNKNKGIIKQHKVNLCP